jgi:hypothetical protein
MDDDNGKHLRELMDRLYSVMSDIIRASPGMGIACIMAVERRVLEAEDYSKIDRTVVYKPVGRIAS